MKKKNIFEGYLNAAGFQPPILWTIPFDNSRISYNFPTELFARYQLVSGVRVCCEIKNDQVVDVISICGKTPEEYLERSDFNKLVPVMPSDKFDFGTSDSLAVRTIDLIAPIGKGTRGLIVSPPRAGKTMLLEAIANDIYRIDPKLHVIILLIDERPEEVTSFQQNTKAPVFFSSLDMGAASHIALSSFLVNHVRTELECGNDIVILIDSLTRMGRAYNIDGNYYNDGI
ncbi:MAG TPA: hypothetical protein PLD62_11430, partial [Candidatus Cloacimonadota bacterium]|nr:hypothetical protein [Candidatus Cloacimonadota bacterium]